MAKGKLSRDEIVERATSVFRAGGFAATTYAELASAAGVEKPSLYYHFPGGKDELVLVVAEAVYRWFQTHVFEPLAVEDVSPAKRLRAVSWHLRAFYADGKAPCILETLSLPAGPQTLKTALAAALSGWLEAFTRLAMASGFSRAQAQRRARQAVIQIEGSLVLTRVQGDSRSFRQAIAGLPTLLLKARNQISP